MPCLIVCRLANIVNRSHCVDSSLDRYPTCQYDVSEIVEGIRIGDEFSARTM